MCQTVKKSRRLTCKSASHRVHSIEHDVVLLALPLVDVFIRRGAQQRHRSHAPQSYKCPSRILAASADVTFSFEPIMKRRVAAQFLLEDKRPAVSPIQADWVPLRFASISASVLSNHLHLAACLGRPVCENVDG